MFEVRSRKDFSQRDRKGKNLETLGGDQGVPAQLVLPLGPLRRKQPWMHPPPAAFPRSGPPTQTVWSCSWPPGLVVARWNFLPPLLGPPLLLLPLFLALPLQPPVRLLLVRVAVVLLPLLLPAPLRAPRGVLRLLGPIIFQLALFQLTIFPANQPHG